MMKTRKRCLNTSRHATSVSTTGPLNADCKRARLSQTSCCQLQARGIAVLQPFRDASLTLEVAADALRGQLTRCSKQPEQERCSAFTSFPRKQRLEHGGETSALPVLQHITRETIHYMAPSMTDASLDANASASCEAHVDMGLLTLIFPDTAQGLQVMGQVGSWEQLLVPEGHIAVLAGYTLERATCGLVKAVTHRVVMGNGGCCTARNVLAYKLRAADSAVIDTYSAISKHHQNIGSRFRTPIGVQELMHFFDATHRSINTPCKSASGTGTLVASQPEAGTQRSAAIQTYLARAAQLVDARRIAVEHAAEQQALAEQQARAAPHRTAKAGPQTLYVCVRSQDGFELQFKLRHDTPIGRVLTAYIDRKGVELSDCRFLLHGVVLWDHRALTCRQLDIESGDIIDFRQHQLGD